MKEWLRGSFQKHKKWYIYCFHNPNNFSFYWEHINYIVNVKGGREHRRSNRAEWILWQLPDSSPIYVEVAAGTWISEVDGFSKGGSQICFSEGFWHCLDEKKTFSIWLWVNCIVLSLILNIFSVQNRYDQTVSVCVCVGHTGWAWQTLAISSQEAPYSMARAASLIISPAPWRRKEKHVQQVLKVTQSLSVCLSHFVKKLKES